MNFSLDEPIAFAPTPQRDWSREQLAIFAQATTSNNLIIEGVAGCGKSTTLEEFSNRLSGSSLFLAFAKANVEDLKSKVRIADVSTINSLGYRTWKQNLPDSFCDLRKVNKVLETLGVDRDTNWNLSKVISFAKNKGLGIITEAWVDDFVDIINNQDLDIPAEQTQAMAAIALKAFKLSVDDISCFDFDDQVYGPVKYLMDLPRYDNVLVDEFQDLNNLQHMLMGMFSNRYNSRLVGVGDTHQAIYAFRGALANSMALAKEQFQMTELPLSTTYRCPKRVVYLARDYCPLIQARDDAPEGEIFYAATDPQTFDRGLIICRTNAPLFRAIMSQVRAQLPCQVLSNFLETFQSFIRKFRCSTTLQLEDKLERWWAKEGQAAKDKKFWSKYFTLKDKYETLKLLCRRFLTVDDIIYMIKRLGDGKTGPTFATIHKAKGLEAHDVYILRPDLMPSPWAIPETQQFQQELNLLYVGITRSQFNLTFGAMES